MSGLANANLLANSEVKNGERGPCGMILHKCCMRPLTLYALTKS